MNLSRLEILLKSKKYIMPVKWNMVALLISAMIAVPVSLISPYFFKLMIDEVMTNKNTETFKIVVLGLLLVYLFRFILDGVNLYCSNKILNFFTLNLRDDIWHKFFKLSFSDYESKDTGDLKMRFFDDVDCLGNFIKDQVVEYIFRLLLIVFSLYMSIQISPQMTIICMGIIPIVFIVNYLISVGTKKINEKMRIANEEYYSFEHNSIQMWREIKAQNVETKIIEEYNKHRLKLAKLGYKYICYWFFTEVFNDFKANYLAKILIYIVGAYFVIQGEITVGILIMYSEYYGMLFTSLDSLNGINVSLRVNMPYYTRIFETLDYKEETEGKVFIDTFSEIHVSKVSFKYNTGNENVLKNIDIKIKKGEYTAIIGKSGCGKTTLAKIILSLYSSKMGQVKIDGVNIHEVSKPSYYENIGFVMQDNYLFNMTLRENFLLANINASEEDMANACKKVNLYSFIDNLPDKFDTVIGERGVKLSGGQKQRIAIAQALLRKPKLIIFDEATSSLDKESEDIINQSITNISKETTIIVISHKPATILRADKIIVLDNGNIVDYGLHDDLIKRNGFLKKLSGGLYEW